MNKYLPVLVAVSLIALRAVQADDQPAAAAAPEAAAPSEQPAQPEQPTAAPKISVDQADFSFGSLDAAQTAEHKYILKNEGEGTLEISAARPSCGCTVASISEKTVPPGGQSEITARLSLAGRSGHQYKTITVDSNDPQQPQLTLILQGDVSTPIAVQPERVIFGQIAYDALITNEVMLVGNDQPFHITAVEAGSPNFEAKVETVEDGKKYRILVSTKAPLPPGGVSAAVHVTTDHPGRQTIDIPVAAAVLSEIMVAPSEIILNGKAGDNISQFVVVRPGSGKTFSVEKVEPPDPAIHVEIAPFGQDGFRIMLQNIVVSPDLDGKVVKITTSSESMKEILVPFRVSIPQA